MHCILTLAAALHVFLHNNFQCNFFLISLAELKEFQVEIASNDKALQQTFLWKILFISCGGICTVESLVSYSG